MMSFVKKGGTFYGEIFCAVEFDGVGLLGGGVCWCGRVGLLYCSSLHVSRDDGFKGFAGSSTS